MFLDLRGFKVLLIIPVIWRKFDILTVISLSFWYETKQHRYVTVFICTIIILLLITISLLTGSLPLKASVFVLPAVTIFILNVSDKTEVSAQPHAPISLRTSSTHWMGKAWSHSGNFRQHKNLSPLPGISSPHPSLYMSHIQKQKPVNHQPTAHNER